MASSRKKEEMTRRTFLNLTKFEMVLVLVVSVAVFVALVVRGQQIQRPEAAADVKLILGAGSNELVSSKTVEVTIDTLGKKISFLDLALKIDSNVLSLNSSGITLTDKFKNAIIKSTPEEARNGVINLTLAVRPEDLANSPSGVFEVARFLIDKNPSVVANNLSTVISVDTSGTQVVDNTARNMTLEATPLVLAVNPVYSTPATITLAPVADTSAVASEPTSGAYGGRTTLLTRSASPQSISFLKFDLSQLRGKTVNKAKFRFRVDSTNSGAGSEGDQLLKEVSSSWNEGGLNFSNMPSRGSLIATNDGGDVGAWEEVDVTTWVRAKVGTQAAFAMESTTADILIFYSREAADKPQLVIEYQ